MSDTGDPMNAKMNFEDVDGVVEFLVEHGVSVECAMAYLELEKWAQARMLPTNSMEKAIEGLAALCGWSEEEPAKTWTSYVTADQILDLCDQYAKCRNTVRRSVVLRELFDWGELNITVMALATVIDACGAELAVSVVKALLKPHVTC